MPARAHQLPRPPARLRAVTWVFAWIACLTPAFAVIVSVLSVFSNDVGWSMVTALLVIPIAILVAAVFGVTTIVLALVLRLRHRDTSKRWLLSLVMGVVAVVVLPVLVVAAISSPL